MLELIATLLVSFLEVFLCQIGNRRAEGQDEPQHHNVAGDVGDRCVFVEQNFAQYEQKRFTE